MTKSAVVRFFDFTGGLNTKSPVTSLKLNQASDLQNINILPSGGFQKRNGNTVFNSTAMNSGAIIHGLGYYRTSLTTDYMMSIAGTKMFKSDNLDGTMDDITGAVTITTGGDNIWTHNQINNLSIFIGGAPDAPIKWNGTGNAAVLGGTPPNGSFGIVANNRLFIGNTTSNPSRIYWCILGNPEDWSGTGSGSQDVSLNDGDTLVGASVIGLDSMLLFKQNSVHTLSIRSAPFPLFPLFSGVGAISKRGIVNVGGIVYFITAEPRMKATDGTTIINFPEDIDDIWDSLTPERLQYIHGIHNRRLNQIHWFVSWDGSTTTNLCLIWDLKKKCWLKHTTGQNVNTSVFAKDKYVYCGGYDGKIYKFDAENKYSDDSEGAMAIDAFWRTGWLDYDDMLSLKYINCVDLNFTTQASGNGIFTTGFNFNPDRNSQIFSTSSIGGSWDDDYWDTMLWGEITDSSKLLFVNGNGKYIQHKIQNNNNNEGFSFNGFAESIIYGGTASIK